MDFLKQLNEIGLDKKTLQIIKDRKSTVGLISIHPDLVKAIFEKKEGDHHMRLQKIIAALESIKQMIR